MRFPTLLFLRLVLSCQTVRIGHPPLFFMERVCLSTFFPYRGLQHCLLFSPFLESVKKTYLFFYRSGPNVIEKSFSWGNNVRVLHCALSHLIFFYVKIKLVTLDNGQLLVSPMFPIKDVLGNEKKENQWVENNVEKQRKGQEPILSPSLLLSICLSVYLHPF